MNDPARESTCRRPLFWSKRSQARTLPISEVKTRLPELVTGVADREEEIVVTRKGKPAAVLVNFAEDERLKATLDVLYRVVSRPARRVVQVLAIGHRRTVYEEVGARLRSEN